MTGLDKALAEIHEEFGEGAIARLGDNHRASIESIPTGSRALDRALGIGGVPRGRMVEIFGPESAGKTTLACHIAAAAQGMGGTAAFIDAEHTFDPTYAQAIGVNTAELLVSQPDYGEQALEIVDRLVTSGDVDVVVVDSVAALTPRAEIEGQMGDQQVGLLARLMSQATRKLATLIGKTKTALVFTNQIREKIGQASFGGPSETQPGGRALRFHAAQRLDIRRIETIGGTSTGEATGIKVRVKVVKNKTAPPYKLAEFEIEYGRGINREAELLDALGPVSQGWYEIDGHRLRGRAKALAYLKEHLDIAERLEAEVDEHLR